MTEHATIIFLSALKSFPVKLARRIGCQEAILFYELMTTYGATGFKFDPNSTYLIGIPEGKKVFDNLILLEYVIHAVDGREEYYAINYNKLTSEAKEALGIGWKMPFADAEFETLITLYAAQLKVKGRSGSVRELCDKFKDKTLSQSIKALKLAYNNSWVTLKFDEEKTAKLQGDSGGSEGRNRIRFGAGGTANKDRNDFGIKSEDI